MYQLYRIIMMGLVMFCVWRISVSIAAVTVFILSKDTFNIYVIQMMKSISDLQDGGASAKEKRRPAKVSSSVGSSSSSKPKKKIKINVEVKKENNKNFKNLF